MALLVSWVAYPLLLSGLGLGCGLLLERIAGRSLPGPLLLPAGFAVVLVAASFTTMRSETASLTAPLVVALAIAGAGLGLPLRRRLDWWAAGAARGRVRRVRRADRPLRRRHLRGLHLAGRHRDVARARRQRDDPRTECRWTRSLELLGRPERRPRQRLPARRGAAARHRPRARRPGCGLALPTVSRFSGGACSASRSTGSSRRSSARGRPVPSWSSWAHNPRCSTATRSGAGSRSSPSRT